MIGRHGLFDHAAMILGSVFNRLQPLFEFGNDTVGQLTGAREVALALSLIEFIAPSVQLLFHLLGRGELFLLFLPAPREQACTLIEIGDLALQAVQPVL